MALSRYYSGISLRGLNIRQRKHVSIDGSARATGWTVGVLFPVRARDLFVLHSVQNGSGGHPASYKMGTGGSFPGSKVAGA
jgi:hypothetical protein